MKVLITFAVESELTSWRRARAFRRTLNGGTVVYEARIADAEVRVVLTGVGARNASRVVRQVFRDVPDLCISSGLAGGLKPEYRRNEVLVARAVCRATAVAAFYERRTGDGGHGPPLQERESSHAVQSDRSLLRLAVDCGATAVDLFHQSDTIVLSAEEKTHMGALADAVDMEGYAIMREAWACGVPAVAIRVVGDPASVDLPLDFNRVLSERGDVSVRMVLAQLAKDPRRLLGLTRFGFQAHRAAASLGSFLDRYVEALASHKHLQEMLSQPVAV